MLNVADEHMAADAVSPWVLLGALCLLIPAAVRVRSWRSLTLVLWLGVLSTLMALRELDLHAVVNPPNMPLIGLDPSWGVRFRLDWWIGAETPAGVRLVWLVIGAGVLGAFVLPLVLCRFPWFRRLRERNAFAWLFVAGLALVAVGYVADDFVARTLEDPALAEALEESAELIGQILIVASAGLLAVRPRSLSGRPGLERSQT